MPVDYTVLTWCTSSWCAQRSPRIAAETNTTSLSNIRFIKNNKRSLNKSRYARLQKMNMLGWIHVGYAPLIKWIWLHRGLTFHNWCRYYNCTEMKDRQRTIINTLLWCTTQDGRTLKGLAGNMSEWRRVTLYGSELPLLPSSPGNKENTTVDLLYLFHMHQWNYKKIGFQVTIKLYICKLAEIISLIPPM